MASSASFEVHVLSLFIGAALKKKLLDINPELLSLIPLILTNLVWVTLLLIVDKDHTFIRTGVNIPLRSFDFDWH